MIELINVDSGQIPHKEIEIIEAAFGDLLSKALAVDCTAHKKKTLPRN
jgi:hypothetical protein